MKIFFTRINFWFLIFNLILVLNTNQYVFTSPKDAFEFNEQIEKDSSALSSDGPIIIYENGKIINYSILPEDTNFNITRKEIIKTDTLTCCIDETKQKFSFQLKDSIKTEKDEYDLPGKMFIISDIEGNFKGFSEILIAAGVIDKDINWTFGDGHLVLVGDFFDRYINVTEILWLIYKLEDEAMMKKGKVHLILGNHEMMNLRGNYKYVRNKYIENAKALKLDYNKWYSPDTELGRWLRTKNSIEKIGSYLFLHGGISVDFPIDNYTLTEINDNIRASIDKVFKEGEAAKDIFIGNQSPLWCRDIVNEKESQEEIDRILKSFNATKMILGHTIVDEIKYLYNTKVIAVDIEHQINSDNGKMYALMFENNDFFVIDLNGTKINLK